MKKSILLIAAAILGSILTCNTLSAQYKTKIEALKGEYWWGIFMAGDQMMPLSAPFSQIDLSTWVKSNVTPFLVSNRGRYIWSKIPFKIEYTGSSFLIDSPMEPVEAVAGGKTLREAYLICCHKNFPPGENAPTPAKEFFTAPIYELRAVTPFGITADQIRHFMQEILEAGYPAGTLIIPNGWQSTIGNFVPNHDLYGDFKGLMDDIHQKGFRAMLTVTPFVSGDGPIYRTYRHSGAFVKLSDGRTAMAEWPGGYSAFFDVTQDFIFNKLRETLASLHDSCGVDGYLFDCTEALPYTRFAHSGAAEYLKKWSELGQGFPLSEYTISRGSGLAPYIHDVEVKLPLSWDYMQQAIPSILTSNILGYPYCTISADITTPADSLSQLLSSKLILRYMQLAATLPVATIDVTPWRSADRSLAELCKKAFEQRAKLGEYYSHLVEECSRTAEPLVRHMEYEFPRNGFVDCQDQFMIGSKYLVAPLLGESNSRVVRFPRGIWYSAKGERYKGPLVTTLSSEDGSLLIFESAK